jgi:hypothetical protein
MVKTFRLLTLAAVFAFQALLAAQSGDADKILASARQALGGDKKLDTVKSLAIEGRSLRITPAGTSTESDFEVAIELPDKYMRRDAVMNMGNMSIYRNSGFNGDAVINEMDTPPQLAGGGNVVMMYRQVGPGGTVTVGPGGTTMSGGPVTPEQQEAARRAMLLNAKQDFARMAVGMFAKSPAAYPLTATFAGQAESPDGKADVIELKGEGEFAAKLFIDASTHLPLMLSWMAKEPMNMVRSVTGGPGGGTVTIAGGGGTKVIAGGSEGAGTKVVGADSTQAPRANMTPEEREKLMKQLDEQAKEAEAKRRVVEYRLFYSDYRNVDGVMLPHRMQRAIDGKPSEEVTFDKVKVNAKIDPKKFTVSK